MVATAFCLGNIFRKFQPDIIINAGIAGAIDRNLQTGSLVNVVQDYLYRFGVEDNNQFISASRIGILNPEVEYLHSCPIDFEMNHLLKKIDALPKVNGVSVQTVHGNADSIEQLKIQHPEAQVESMEGAAVFYAGMMENIPVIQLRSISNYVEPRNRSSWKMDESIGVLNDFLISIFEPENKSVL